MRRAIGIAVLLTVGVVVAAVVLANVPVHWAVLLALPAGAVAFAGGLLAGSAVTLWEPEPEPPAAKVTINATFLTERLERATGDQQTFTTRVQPRLRHIAVAALQQDLNTQQAKEALGAELERVAVHDDVLRYCVDLSSATRTHRSVEVGASPRGSQALLLVARALAVLDGREYVLPEDVKECAVAALAHRLTMRAETWSSGVTGVQVVTELLDQVPGPATTRPETP